MLIIDLPLLEETREVVDELLPTIQSIREGKKISLPVEKKARVVALLNHFEVKAMTPQLRRSLRDTVEGLSGEINLTQFGIVTER